MPTTRMSRPAWSTPVTLGLRQQQSRHTTMRHGTGPVAVAGLSSSVVGPVGAVVGPVESVVGPLGVAGMRRRPSLRGDPPLWSVEEATA
ncbi:hypothetical protein NI25_00255 [Streptomyces sp. CCM_MD2014]|nr:hypothetical protein NI25_00255 [Streptomyces sp. CCM_MD2014]